MDAVRVSAPNDGPCNRPATVHDLSLPSILQRLRSAGRFTRFVPATFQLTLERHRRRPLRHVLKFNTRRHVDWATVFDFTRNGWRRGQRRPPKGIGPIGGEKPAGHPSAQMQCVHPKAVSSPPRAQAPKLYSVRRGRQRRPLCSSTRSRDGKLRQKRIDDGPRNMLSSCKRYIAFASGQRLLRWLTATLPGGRTDLKWIECGSSLASRSHLLLRR